LQESNWYLSARFLWASVNLLDSFFDGFTYCFRHNGVRERLEYIEGRVFMGSRARFGLGLLSWMTVLAYADEQSKDLFNLTVTESRQKLQGKLASGNVKDSRDLAAKQVKSINSDLRAYEKFGPNQRIAAADYASAVFTEDVVDQLANLTSDDSDHEISVVVNSYLESNYGMHIKFDDSKKAWVAEIEKDEKGNDKPESVAKVKKIIASKIAGDKEMNDIWTSLSSEKQDDVAQRAILKLNADLKTIIAKDGKTTNETSALFKKKSEEISDKENGRIVKYKNELDPAKNADEAERNLLGAQKTATEAVANAKEGRSLKEYCDDYVKGIDDQADLERVIGAMGKNASKDPCHDPLKEKLATKLADGKKADRKPSGIADKDSSPLYEEKDSRDSDKDDRDDDSDDDSDDHPKAGKMSRGTKRQLAQMNQALEQLQNQYSRVQGEKDQLANALQVSQLCRRGVGPQGDPFQFNADNRANMNMLKSLSKELQNVTTDNTVEAFCSLIDKHQSPDSAFRTVARGMGLADFGPMTLAQQQKFADVVDGAMGIVGSIHSQQYNRAKYTATKKNAAVTRALSSIMENNPGYLNLDIAMNVKSALAAKRLSYQNFVGGDNYGVYGNNGITGQLQLLAANPIDPINVGYVEQIFNTEYESALLALDEEEGLDQDQDKKEKCALAFLEKAGPIYSAEMNRSAALGIGRQQALGDFTNTLATMEVTNAKSDSKPTKKYGI
jgi:hypothetical protein